MIRRILAAFVLVALLLTPLVRVSVREHGVVGQGGILYLQPLPKSVSASLPARVAPGYFTHIGYCYSSVSIIPEIAVWMWDGTYCLAAHDGGMQKIETRAIARAELAALIAPATVPAPPFFYRYPPGLLFVAFVLLVGAPIAVVRRRALDHAPAPISLT